MPAMNGSAVSFRKGRIIGLCMAAVLVVVALFASSASAMKAPLTPTNYTALGDSLAFGYTAEKFNNTKEEGAPPSAFEGGYANVLNAKLAKLEKKEGNQLSLINMGCPGEVSDGLIGENKSLGGGGQGNGKPDSSPCAYHKAGFPLHFNIGSGSQLESAIGVVTTPGTFGATKLVTVNIGSNDELAVVKACTTPAYLAEHGFGGGPFECLTVEAGESGTYYEKGLFHHIIANTGDVIGVLRAFGYAGPVAILGFYNPQSFILPGSDSLQKQLNETFEGVVAAKTFGPGVVYANPFPLFNPQKAKTEKARIAKYTEECNPNVQNFQGGADPGCEGDIHPTPLGYKKLAAVLYTALGH